MNHQKRILALETTGLSGSVAALAGGEPLQAVQLADGQRSARALAPAINEACRQVGWRPAEVELIAVTVGPGSFTGLRVGVTAAKTLAYAAGAEVIGVDATEVVAAQAPGGLTQMWVAFDAQRGELFVSRIRRNAGDPLSAVHAEPGRIVDAATWLAARGKGEVLTGPGLARWQETAPPGVVVIERALWQPQAMTVGLVGWRHYQAGERCDLWSLSPRYIRASAAEEKLGK